MKNTNNFPEITVGTIFRAGSYNSPIFLEVTHRTNTTVYTKVIKTRIVESNKYEEYILPIEGEYFSPTETRHKIKSDGSILLKPFTARVWNKTPQWKQK